MWMLIGPAKEKLPQLRIKVHADHAGLSQLLLLWRVLFLLAVAQLSVSQSNNWLTAQEAMEIKDAMEDGWTLPLIISEIREFPPLINIPTLLEIKHAKSIREILNLMTMLMLMDALT
jgi:hypothetical protein